MLHHVSVGVSDVARAAKFYDAVLKTLGYKRVADFSPHAIGYGTGQPEFWIGPPHDGKPKQNAFKTLKQVPPKTAMSEGLSKELKSRGFNFVGPVIVYAFAQAVGMVNDHIVSCHCYSPVAKLGRARH